MAPLTDSISGVGNTATYNHRSLELVWAVAYSPDGSRIVSGSDDNTLKVWNAETSMLLMTLSGHTGGVHAIAYSPDGKLIVSGSFDRTLKVWEADTGEETITFAGHKKPITSCAFSPDGRRIVSASADNVCKIWTVFDGNEQASVGGAGLAARFRLMYTRILWWFTVRFTFPRAWRDTYRKVSHSAVTTAKCSFFPNGTHVVSWAGLFSWDVLTKQKKDLAGTMATGCACSPDGEIIIMAVSEDATRAVSTIKSAQVLGGKEIRRFGDHKQWVSALACCPDGRHTASASMDRTLKIWNNATGDECCTLAGHTNWVWSVAYSPDGSRIVSGSADCTAKIWDIGVADEHPTVAGHASWVRAVAYSPDGTRIISGSDDKTLKLWDGVTGAELGTFIGDEMGVQAVACHPNGSRIVSGSADHHLYAWAMTGSVVSKLNGHGHWVYSVAYAPNGKCIISGSEDATLRLWDGVRCKKKIVLKSAVKDCAYSPDGMLIACGLSDGMIKIMNAATCEERETTQASTASINSVAFSPDGKHIASGSEDGYIKVWDVLALTELGSQYASASALNSVAFSPDGERIICGSEGAALMVFDGELKQCLDYMLCLGGVLCCDFDGTGTRMCCGDASGGVYVLELIESSSHRPAHRFIGRPEKGPTNGSPQWAIEQESAETSINRLPVVLKSDLKIDRLGLAIVIFFAVFLAAVGYILTLFSVWLRIIAVPTWALSLFIIGFSIKDLRCCICPSCGRSTEVVHSATIQICAFCKREFTIAGDK